MEVRLRLLSTFNFFCHETETALSEACVATRAQAFLPRLFPVRSGASRAAIFAGPLLRPCRLL